MLFKEHLKQKSWSHHWAYPQPASWQIKRIKKKISVGLEWTKGESDEKDKKNKEETFFFLLNKEETSLFMILMAKKILKGAS